MLPSSFPFPFRTPESHSASNLPLLMVRGRRFLPDSGDVNPELMHQPAAHALAPEAVEQLLSLSQPRLRSLFRTRDPVTLVPAPAGILREIGLRATIEHRVLVLVAGAESAALADTAEALGAEVIRLMVHPGQTPEPELLERFLSSPAVDSVALVHAEASTGVLVPLRELAAVVRKRPDVVLFVDATGSLGGVPLETDEWGLDFVLGSSSGPLGLPTGLSFAAASARLLARTRGLAGRGVLLDFLTHHAAAAEGNLLTAINPLLAVLLDRQLERVETEGLVARWERHRAVAALVEAWVEARARVSLLAVPGRRSPTVSCLRVAPPHTAASMAEALMRLGWHVGVGESGGGAHLQIGHMGDVTPGEMEALLAAIAGVLEGDQSEPEAV